MSPLEAPPTETLDMKVAFPNPAHRLLYRTLHVVKLANAMVEAAREARALGALHNIPGIAYSDEDRARIKRVEERRREEIYTAGMQRVDNFMLEHNLGSVAFQESVLANLDD